MIVSSTIIAAFKTSKYGSKASNCADSFAISPDGMKIAIADGVSKSYMPKYVADALTEIYVSNKFPEGALFERENATELLSEVIKRWNFKSRELEASVDEDTALDLEEQRELYGMGASTFAGISLGSDLFSFVVLGDSCIFIIPEDSSIAPLILSSMPCEIDASASQPFKCEFGTHPHFLDTNGRIVGEPLEDSIKACNCIIFMATDAFSDWFCRNYSRKNGYQIFESLVAISSQDEFDSFINELRDKDLKNDDVAFVLAKVCLIENESTNHHDNNGDVSEESLSHMASYSINTESEDGIATESCTPRCDEFIVENDSHQNNTGTIDKPDEDSDKSLSITEESEGIQEVKDLKLDTEGDNVLDDSENSSEDIEVGTRHKATTIFSKIKECLGLS